MTPGALAWDEPVRDIPEVSFVIEDLGLRFIGLIMESWDRDVLSKVGIHLLFGGHSAAFAVEPQKIRADIVTIWPGEVSLVQKRPSKKRRIFEWFSERPARIGEKWPKVNLSCIIITKGYTNPIAS
jgi:hypothetical protein